MPPQPGPLALLGSGENLPVVTDVARPLLAGRPAVLAQILNAAAEDEAALRHWLELGAALAGSLGARHVPVTSAGQVAGAGLVYLSGGNPRLLAHSLRGTDLWPAVLDAWGAGSALAGCAAGALALTDWIPLLAPPRGEADPGLGLLPHLRVIPHFDRMLSWAEDLIDYATSDAPPGVSVLGLDEDTALVDPAGTAQSWLVHGRQQAWTLHPGTRTPHPAGTTLLTPAAPSAPS